MKSNTLKGYLFALVATLAFSNVYIFSKAALNEIHLTQFGLYWCALGVFFSLLFAVKGNKIRQISFLSKKQVRILLILGGLEILTTSTFFILDLLILSEANFFSPFIISVVITFPLSPTTLPNLLRSLPRCGQVASLQLSTPDSVRHSTMVFPKASRRLVFPGLISFLQG